MLEKVGEGEDPPPRFLYLFSDCARALLGSRSRSSNRARRHARAFFVDVGADKPKDLAIEKVEVDAARRRARRRIQIQATVRATGADFDTELLCQLDNDPDSER